MFETTTEYGQRVTRRLQQERILWLTTVDSHSRPQPRPVWFFWDGETFLIYSRPETAKLRHILHNPNVALNLDGDGMGGDIIVINGVATIDETGLPAASAPDYIEKYSSGFERIGLTAAQFAETYSVAVRVTPTNLRGH
jgi:PPOX class probable F420-dependent enzyme